jgi:hypothetical protein
MKDRYVLQTLLHIFERISRDIERAKDDLNRLLDHAVARENTVDQDKQT